MELTATPPSPSEPAAPIAEAQAAAAAAAAADEPIEPARQVNSYSFQSDPAPLDTESIQRLVAPGEPSTPELDILPPAATETDPARERPAEASPEATVLTLAGLAGSPRTSSDVQTGVMGEHRATAGRRNRNVPLATDAVRTVVARGMPGVRRCYERNSRRLGQATEENLTLELRVALGAVASADVSGATNPRLEECVESAVRRWTFPAGSAVVSLPLRLRPQIN